MQGCPYCAKVRDKLSDLDLEYESRIAPSVHAEREEVEEVSGQAGVSVLVDEGHDVEGMLESNNVIDYLEETYGSAA